MKPINMRATMNNIIATTITEILAEQQCFLDPANQQQAAQLQLTTLTQY